MRLHVLHKTHYTYPSPVRDSFNELRLQPLSNDWQRCESCFVSVLPIAPLGQYLDLNGNLVHHFEISEDHSKLIIESRSITNYFETC
jgi:transglutaminase-like putative cysteine protease